MRLHKVFGITKAAINDHTALQKVACSLCTWNTHAGFAFQQRHEPKASKSNATPEQKRTQAGAVSSHPIYYFAIYNNVHTYLCAATCAVQIATHGLNQQQFAWVLTQCIFAAQQS